MWNSLLTSLLLDFPSLNITSFGNFSLALLGKYFKWRGTLKKMNTFGITLYTLLYIFKEKVMATHSSTLAWSIPWTKEPGGLQSMRSQRVGHDWATSLSLFTFMHQRRKWQPTPVFLPGESQGRGRLVGCRRELDMADST